MGEDLIRKLHEKRKALREIPSEKAARLHNQGMLTARERIDHLLDSGSFFELDLFASHHYRDFGMDGKKIPADGVVTGFGTINGRKTSVYAQDFTALGGTFGEMHGRKICALMDTAAEIGVPVIGICHSGGLRLHETLGPMEMFGQLFRRNTLYSGWIPQISVILGVVAGGQAYSPGLTDFILMTRKSSIYIAGPAFVKAQTGTEITDTELGGAEMHARVSGLIDVLSEDEQEVLENTRRLFQYLPLSCQEKPPREAWQPEFSKIGVLNQLVPPETKKPFDMKSLLAHIVDMGSFFELKPIHAKNMIVGFARLAGRVVGVVANQPKYLGGVIDIKGAEKGARFVRFCDAFNIPLITFQDSPGYLIGKEMEQGGMIYKGAKLLHAYAEATVPKVTVIIRKAYAGAYIAMGSRYIGADLVYAWPGAEICSVSPKTAASILFREEMRNAATEDEIERLYQTYYEREVNPKKAASLRHINDIIEPSETRNVLIRSLEILETKKKVSLPKKHGNIPL